MHVRPWVQPCLEKCPQKACTFWQFMQEAETQTVLQRCKLYQRLTSPGVQRHRAALPMSSGLVRRQDRPCRPALRLPQRLRYSVPPPPRAAAPPRRHALRPTRPTHSQLDAPSTTRTLGSPNRFACSIKLGGGNWACGPQFAVLGSQLPVATPGLHVTTFHNLALRQR